MTAYQLLTSSKNSGLVKGSVSKKQIWNTAEQMLSTRPCVCPMDYLTTLSVAENLTRQMMRWLNFQCGQFERTVLLRCCPGLWSRGWWKQRETSTMRSKNATRWNTTSHHPITTCDGRCQWRRVQVNYTWRNIDHCIHVCCNYRFQAVQMSSKHDLLW